MFDKITEIIEYGIEQALSNYSKIIWGKVVKVNEKTIDIQPGFKGLYNGEERQLPLLINVPPMFLHGGSSYRADPISVGDFALVFIADRCIEQWYYGNDNQVPRQFRMHDLADAFAIVGIRQLANAITIPNVITEIGDKYIEGDYIHYGNVTINGSLTVIGGDVVADGISLKNHTHLGDSGGNTSKPQ